MPPDERPIPRFIAEPPQEPLPYGRWAATLSGHFQEAVRRIETEEDLGEPGTVNWFPERSWGGRTFVPATAPTANGYEVFGYVSFALEDDGTQATDFAALADWTDETAEANPDWKLDLSDEEIDGWRGARDLSANVALVWGASLVPGGALATAELGPTTTDQCEVVEDRFTLVSLDSWTGDLLEVKLWGGRGDELATESLYEED